MASERGQSDRLVSFIDGKWTEAKSMAFVRAGKRAFPAQATGRECISAVSSSSCVNFSL